MAKIRKNGVILGGCLAFKKPVGLSYSSMRGLTKRLASTGHPNLTCENHISDIPVQDSVGKDFYFYRIREGGQEKSFVINQLREMRLRPASLAESASLAHVEFSKLRSAIGRIDLENNLFQDLVPLVCLATTMVADTQKFHPILKCRPDREMVVDGAMCDTDLILDGLIPVTDRQFECWNPA